MKLSTKLSLVMGTLMVFILLVGGIGIYQMRVLNERSALLAKNWIPAIVAIETMNSLFSDFRIAEVQHVFATDPQVMKNYEEKMTFFQKAAAEQMQKYEAIPMADEGRRMYENYIAIRKQYAVLHDKFIELSRENETTQAIKILNGEGLQVYNTASTMLGKLVDRNVDGADKISAENEDIYASASTFIVALLAVAVLTALTVAVYIIRNTLYLLGKDPAQLGLIAKRVTDGDYAIDDGSPQIGVYGNIVGMVTSLKQHIESARSESERAQQESVKAQEAMENATLASAEAQKKTQTMLTAADKLEEIAGIVSSASTELSAQIEQSERGANEQAARVTETATAVDEMNSTVLEVAKNAGSAAEVSSQTKTKAENGATVVRDCISAIGNVQKNSLALKDDMATLGEHAKNISQIMSVISDIADQTNLLALNAAIEAARAGEAGRGFAVVADEVRKLAEKTMASTTDVGNAIRSIQQSADASAKQVETTVQNVETATGLVGQCGDALHEIVSLAELSADQVRAIATASEQQSSTSEEIARSMSQVNTIASETARTMEEASHAVSDLANQAQVLTGLIGDMKRG